MSTPSGPYGTSKLAALGLAEELHKELAVHHGRPLERMRVVVLCPAIVVTDLLTSGEEATGGAVKARVTCEEDNAVCLLRTL